ncbi:hypothetical protein GOODEAATRI_007485 [Goodea atripinnis]|uniref:Uncharacterized protein n=1 Tax=Goodea atripinnis TaxID=208336 RepID=A0ABV0PC77_9TELE
MLPDLLDTSVSCFVVRIWGGQKDQYQLLIEWKVNLDGLRYTGQQVSNLLKQHAYLEKMCTHEDRLVGSQSIRVQSGTPTVFSLCSGFASKPSPDMQNCSLTLSAPHSSKHVYSPAGWMI